MPLYSLDAPTLYSMVYAVVDILLPQNWAFFALCHFMYAIFVCQLQLGRSWLLAG